MRGGTRGVGGFDVEVAFVRERWMTWTLPTKCVTTYIVDSDASKVRFGVSR
jgi:hypothetical protein